MNDGRDYKALFIEASARVFELEAELRKARSELAAVAKNVDTLANENGKAVSFADGSYVTIETFDSTTVVAAVRTPDGDVMSQYRYVLDGLADENDGHESLLSPIEVEGDLSQ